MAEKVDSKSDEDDVAPTFIDLEFAAKTDRILAVLDNSIEKAQLALCLPLLLQNNAILLRSLLTSEQLAVITSACSKYQDDAPASLPHDVPSSTLGSFHPSADSESSRSEKGQEDRWSSIIGLVQGKSGRQDPNISQALHILSENEGVSELVKNRLLPLVSPTARMFLEYLSRLRRCAAERLSRTPETERIREAQLCAAWRSTREAEAERQKLTNQLNDQRAHLGGQVEAKARGVAQLRQSVDSVRIQCQEEVKRIVNQSERAMIADWRNSQARQGKLNTELKEAKDTMAATLAEHLKEEKELRIKRHKVETLLLTWLQKFDADVGEKHQEFQQLSQEFEAEQEQLHELQERMAEQEQEYRELLAEKERYEKEEEDEKVFMLASKWAAKVIQRAWRAYRLRKRLAKSAKKKGKGKGKGKSKPK